MFLCEFDGFFEVINQDNPRESADRGPGVYLSEKSKMAPESFEDCRLKVGWR